jgi:hypothetical protein
MLVHWEGFYCIKSRLFWVSLVGAGVPELGILLDWKLIWRDLDLQSADLEM